MHPKRVAVTAATEAQANVFAACWNDLGWECSLTYPGTLAHALGDGFLVVSVDGHLAGCIVAVLNEGDSPAFIGYYAILPAFRGQGYGKHLWNAAIEWIKEELRKQARPIAIALDSVAETIPLYRSQGFVETEHAVTIWQRPADCQIIPVPEQDSSRIQRITHVLEKDVIAYDKRGSGIQRGHLLSALVQTPGWSCWCIRDSSDEISGFVAVRPSLSGFDIGPLHTRSPEEASQLLSHAIQTLSPNQVFRAEVWSSNPDAEALFVVAGFVKDESHAFQRMILGDASTWQCSHTEMYAVLDSGLG